MIIGVHALIYSKEPEQVRAFLKDVLEFKPIDIGHGWLIFALPPAELAVHPGEGPGRHELYLMCDDVKALIKKLESKGYETREVQDVGWGLRTAVALPGGDELGIYGGRLYQRRGSSYVLQATFGDAKEVPRGLKVPLAKIQAQDPSKYPGGKITLPASWKE